MKTGNFIQETKASEDDQKLFNRLGELLLSMDATPRDVVTNLALFARSSVLAKVLFVNELYQRILHIPGNIYEFGSWMGQNLILFENLRAIYEPFNQCRKFYGFDTYCGYPALGTADSQTTTLQPGGYSVSNTFLEQFDELSVIHETLSVAGHTSRIRRIAGDVETTISEHFRSNKSELVALAYFDMALYEPTRVALAEVLERSIPGTVIMFDELNHPNYIGETVAFLELMRNRKFKIEKSHFLTDRSIVTLL